MRHQRRLKHRETPNAEEIPEAPCDQSCNLCYGQIPRVSSASDKIGIKLS